MTTVMGIVNVTPDSFSDGGMWLDTDAGVRHGHQLLADGADLLELLLDPPADRGIARQKDEPHPILSGIRQRDARGLADFGEKRMRHLDENAGAISRVDLCSGGAAMVEVPQNLETIGDNLV